MQTEAQYEYDLMARYDATEQQWFIESEADNG